MKELKARSVVIGSGCAGLNAADWLKALGEDVLLVTDGLTNGTSRNTGSDKQTYYKLSLSGDDGDSVGAMTQTLKREDVDGDLALCEAAGSAVCFLKLAALGVRFPTNEYGEYVGYQTDHDVRRRASSAGPLTSRFMTEALERSVLGRGVTVLDHFVACRILKDDRGVRGVLCLDKKDKDWLLIRCAHIVLATGGPAAIYYDSVYPESQYGMSGMALEAGAEGQNLDCWQYGLASVKFRWNVSGSYQQALPRYVSVDACGAEHDFLSDSLGISQALNMTFLKGYQWPFDPAEASGSSQVDILVKRETDRGRRVFLDYRRNPTGFSLGNLSDEARAYLVNCGAWQSTPIERLRAINAPAIQLYLDHCIDLTRDMLEIRVCAQHHNGGIAVDSSWQTCVQGLYACGEAAGTFGLYRPGGTALNSTQVGSMRAAQHIARESHRQVSDSPLSFEPPAAPEGDPYEMTERLQKDMSRHAAFQRDEDGVRSLLTQIEQLRKNMSPVDPNVPDAEARLRLRDMLETQAAVLQAMLYSLTHEGIGVLMTRHGDSFRRVARPIPERDQWFERVWKRYRKQEIKET